MPFPRFALGLTLLLLSGVLLVLAGLQAAVIVDAFARFGRGAASSLSATGTRTLIYALPGLAMGALAVMLLRRRR